MRDHTLRSWVGITACLALGLAFAAPAQAQSKDAAQELADLYAPITKVRDETNPPCEITAEQYAPTAVSSVLDNPTVTLTKETEDGSLKDLVKGPSAEDLVGLGDGYFLNLNGDPLGDTCVYSREFKGLQAKGVAPVVTYAHIAREQGQDGFALQYWFFWYFNQFNDLHEADWEGMQLTFGVDTPAEALATEPEKIILFQHAGGERAGWDEAKVQKDQQHPIVFPAAGSHATFYDSTVYVENGDHGSGVGCDNTSAPLKTLQPRPILLPNRVSATGPFKWLGYNGRWGQREKGFNNGPTGPQTKSVWREPFTWMEGQRTTSPRLPGGSLAGPSATKAFCGAVSAVTSVMNDASRDPLIVYGFVALLALVLIGLVLLTKWRPIDLERLRVRRSFGQILRTARQLYGRHWRPMLAVAAVAVPILGLTNALGSLFSGESSVNAAPQTDDTGFSLAIADTLVWAARPVASAVVAALVIVIMRQLADGSPVGFRGAWQGMRERFWRVVGGQFAAILGVVLLAMTIVGIPVAIWKLIGWSFVQQEVLCSDKSVRGALRGSSDLVRGRWFHALRVAGFLYLVGIVVGPFLGFILIFTALPLVLVNLIASVVFALLIPFTTAGDTLLYYDLQARAQEEGIKPARHWRPWRPREFGRQKVAPEPGVQPA